MKKKLTLILVIIAILVAYIFSANLREDKILVTDFQSCADAGYPIMESNPRQCNTPEGRNFVEEIDEENGNEEEPPSECPKGFFPRDTNCQCPEGYVKGGQAGNPAPGSEPISYCRIDKEWNEFDSCQTDDDCSQEESCIAQYPEQREEPSDFRCINFDEYQLDCYCEPDKGCVCN